MKDNLHNFVELALHNGEIINVDVELSSLIYLCNKEGYKTLYSCQGNDKVPGYIKFADDTDIKSAYFYVKSHLDCICILDVNNIVRFFPTYKCWKNYYKIKKYWSKKCLIQ